MPQFLIAIQPATPIPQVIDILKTLQTAGGTLLQAWGPWMLLGDGPPAAQAAVTAKPGVAQTAGATTSIVPVPGIDAIASELIAAFNFGFSPAFLSPPAPTSPLPFLFPPTGCGAGAFPSTLAPGATPSGLIGARSDPGLALAPAVVNTARRALVGTVGIAIVQIDGPPGSAARFTPDEWFWSVKGITMGFDALYTLAPAGAHLVFSTAIHHVEIDLDPTKIRPPVDPTNPTPAEYENIEATWREKALVKLGAGTGHAGFRNIVNKSNFLFKPDWGFVLIVTKYRAAWPAYAPDYRDLILSYDMVKAQIGLPELPHVIAHEIGHTVGALDEYTSAGHPCSVLDKCGFSNFPNANCEALNPLSVDCLMKRTISPICQATRSHFGWADQNLDGFLDPFDPTFVPFP